MLLINSGVNMAHNVYICYDEKDLDEAKQVCDALEGNGLDCWLKNRDAGVKHMVDEIMTAIKESKVVVLLYSKNSKNSNFVNNEIDTAFSQKRSILVYQIDDTKLEGSLEFFLRNKPWIKAYPNPEEKFDVLVEDTSRLLKEQKHKDNRNAIGTVGKYKIPIIIGCIVVVAAIVGFMMFAGNTDTTASSQIHAGDYKLKITNFEKFDVRKQQNDWNFSYSIEGTISPVPSDDSGCVIVVEFYDDSGKIVDTSETPIEDAQKVGAGFLFGSATSGKDTIKRAEVQLLSKDSIIIAQDESQL